LLGQPVNHESAVNKKVSQDKQIEKNENQKEYRYDWMWLAEIGSKARIQNDFDLGSRDMDQNYD